MRFPADSVTLCAESVGIQPSQEAACGIVEDVSFRIRQLTDIASQFMRHAKRQKLIGDDIDKAMKWSGLEPLYGHCSDRTPSFQSIHASGLYSIPDPEVKLSEIAFSTLFTNSLPLPKPLSIKASWIALEGTLVPIGMQGLSCSSHNSVIELRRPVQETHHRYLSLLLEAVTGENEDLRRVALNDIQTNPSFANVLSEVVQYLSEALSVWPTYFPYQILRLLKLLTAILKNTSLFLDSYVHIVFPLVKSIIFNESYLHNGVSSSHWNVREAAAMCLAIMELRRCGCSLNVEVRELHGSCRQALASVDTPLHVLYGVVVTLSHLGTKSLVSVLLPYLDAVNSRLQALLTSSPSVSHQESIFNVCDALLLAAQVLLTLDTEQTTGAKKQTSLEEIQNHSTLYGHLMDLFGEKLVLLLCAQASYMPVLSAKESSTVLGTPPVPPFLGRALPSDDSLLKFLSQEGFRSTRTSPLITQLKQRGPGRLFGGREPFRIAVRWRKVPVQGNVLEDMGSQGVRQRLGVAQRGSAQALKSKSRTIKAAVLGVGSCWL